MMNPREFFINPADYGLPTQEESVAYRIWDNHWALNSKSRVSASPIVILIDSASGKIRHWPSN